MTQHGSALVHVLVAMIAVIVAARALGTVFRFLRQPPVVGEMVAGILLGPSLLGRFAPGVSAFVFPAAVTPHLQVIAQIGVLLFMFLVGLELDTSLLKKRSAATLGISLASILVPLLLGALSAFVVYPKLAPPHVPFGTFALFLAVSVSVTAFPVLARILADLGRSRSDLGVMALACAALSDVTAWCLLALVVSVVRSNAGLAVRTLGLTAGYVVLMLAVVRPVVARLVARQELVRKVSAEAERQKGIEAILNRANPGPGGYYDDLGNPAAQPHLETGPGYAEDPDYFVAPKSNYLAFGGGVNGRRSAEALQPDGAAAFLNYPTAWWSFAEARWEGAISMRYRDLDPAASYRLKVVYVSRSSREEA